MIKIKRGFGRSIVILTLLIMQQLFSSWSGSAHADVMPDGWPWRGISINYPGSDVEDIERFKKKLNINFVRLNINVKRHAKLRHLNKKQAFHESMLWADRVLNACARLNIRATVEINKFPIDQSLDKQMRTPQFWKNKNIQDEIIWVAGQLAKSLKKHGSELAAFQILSEPVVFINGRAQSPPEWEDLLQKIVLEIRKYDPQRWIVVSPGPGGGPRGYANFTPPSDSRLIWGAHMYIPHAFTHQGIKDRPLGEEYPGRMGSRLKYWDKDALRNALKSLLQFQNRHPAPVFIGEFSAVRWAEGGELYIRDLASIFNEYGWGWTYFSATGWHGWNPDYNQHYPGKGKKIIWKKSYVGERSVRWKTLRDIFSVEEKQ